jgi:hypothetical protein
MGWQGAASPLSLSAPRRGDGGVAGCPGDRVAVRLVEPTIGVAATDHVQQHDGLRLVVAGFSGTDGEGPSPLSQQVRGFRVFSVAGSRRRDLDE